MSDLFLKPQKGSGVHFLGWDGLWEMRGCRLVATIGTFTYVLLCYLDLSLSYEAFPGGVSSLNSRVT
jgi:hypothetical protein